MAAIPAAERVYPGEEGRQVFSTERRRGVEGHRLHLGETAAMVSYGGPIALMRQYILGLPYKRPMPFAINNCSLTYIDVSEDVTLSH